MEPLLGPYFAVTHDASGKPFRFGDYTSRDDAGKTDVNKAALKRQLLGRRKPEPVAHQQRVVSGMACSCWASADPWLWRLW